MTTYSAVVTTGIYCRPGCGARPLAHNTRTFELAAAAEAAGFRACYRCRPYRVAGPVGSNAPEIVCEAVQLIIGGALDDGGTEAALAATIGMSPRHLRRLFLKHLGATPDQLARSRRAHFARRLLDDTDLTVLEVAFASGFGSLRQFNRCMGEVFRAAPSELRERRRRADRLTADGGLALRLPVLPGYDWNAVCSFLAARATPGVEAVDGDTYRRTIIMMGSPGLIEVSPGLEPGYLLLRAHLPYWEGLIHVVDRIGRALGVDADHGAPTIHPPRPGRTPHPGHLTHPGHAADGIANGYETYRESAADVHLTAPGVVIPGAWNPFEVGVWAILSDQPDRERLLTKLVQHLGNPVAGLPMGLTRTYPDPAAVARPDLEIAGLPPDAAIAIADLAGTLTVGGEVRLEAAHWRPWLELAATHLGTRPEQVARRNAVALDGAGREAVLA
jgi:AraC family transcriptional regulator of adaptative response / DNA-3-methyladenine glycosylase II